MAGGASGGDEDLITAINVTPLVDIILVLLIIFMVTTEVIHEADKPRVIPVQLPDSATAEQMLALGVLNLVIDGTGTLYLNGKESTFGKIDLAIETIREKSKRPAHALISADARVPHGEVASLMDFLRSRKVFDIMINTRSQEID